MGKPPPLRGLPFGLGCVCASGLPLLELSVLTPWCALLCWKWGSLETTQKAERGRPHPDVPTPEAQCWLRATEWREEPPGGGSRGSGSGLGQRPPVCPHFCTEFTWAAGARDWGAGGCWGRKREISVAPSGYAQLPVSTETMFQKQISSFFNHFFPMVTHFCS